MNCPDCGNPNPPHAVECEFCGRTLVVGEGARRTRLDRDAPPPDAAKRRTVFESGPGAAPPAPPDGRRLVDDPFASPPARRMVYDPQDPFRAAIHPTHVPTGTSGSSASGPSASAGGPATPPPPVVQKPAADVATARAPVAAGPAAKGATIYERTASTHRRATGVLVAMSAPDDPGRVFVLYEGRNTLGREESQDVRIEDGKVSSQHAFVFLRADGASFIDVSTNGSLVDGKVVHGQQVELRSGSVVRVGQTVIVFTQLAAVPADAWGAP